MLGLKFIFELLEFVIKLLILVVNRLEDDQSDQYLEDVYLRLNNITFTS